MKTLVLASSALAALAAFPDAQQYQAAVAYGGWGVPDSAPNNGPSPTQRFRTDLPVGGNHTGSAVTSRSKITGSASVYPRCCHFQDPVTCRGVVIWNDVVFTSSDPLATTVPVSVFLRIPSGSFSGNARSSVRVSFNGVGGEWGTFVNGMGQVEHMSSGGLTGYTGTGNFDFSLGPIVFPLNAPTTFGITFDVISESFGPNEQQTTVQSLAFGSSLDSGAIFGLPAGVTANSVQGNIVNNAQAPDAGYYLGSNPTTVLEGAAMDLSSWNGIPGSPALLFVTGHNALFNIIQQFAVGSLDAGGQWVYPFTVPTGISGCTVQFHAVSLNALGKLSISNGTLVTVQ